ncbi:MAG TPA: hypothetical protein VH678_05970 [Xanthobacteraceae bacterium]|jgi:hypothetical protein
MAMAARCFDPSEYNDFLFATIGEERNETPLSVLSALTRLDVDPWQEAARLARLPKNQAIRDISSAIGSLPGDQWTASETSRIAARLVELLPSPKESASFLLPGDRIERRIVLGLTLMWIIFASAWIAFVVRTSSPNHPAMHADSTVIAQQLSSLQSH